MNYKLTNKTIREFVNMKYGKRLRGKEAKEE